MWSVALSIDARPILTGNFVPSSRTRERALTEVTALPDFRAVRVEAFMIELNWGDTLQVQLAHIVPHFSDRPHYSIPCIVRQMVRFSLVDLGKNRR